MHNDKSKKPSDKRLFAFLKMHDKNNERENIILSFQCYRKKLEGECRHSYKRENKHNKSSPDRSRDNLEFGVWGINRQ